MNKKFRPTPVAAATHQAMSAPEGERASAQAAPSDERAFDALAERFFSGESIYPCEIDLEPQPSAPKPNRAMRATLLMLAVSGVTLLAFLAYMKLIMPVPAELGADAVLPLVPASSTANVTAADTSRTDSQHAVLPPTAAGTSEQTTPPTAAVAANTEATPASEPEHATTTTEPTWLAEPAVVTRKAHPARRSPDLVARAYARLGRGEPEKALLLAREATERTPQRGDAWIALASAYTALRDPVSARAAFRICTQRASDAFALHCRSLARD